ncbi:hypothetical protein EJ06DRAFT_94441 [Trichodelitschia bisporula]|uniref:Uncharacterized protein n=1 Tax=Trichodelitschia bisporula TaxID=703511 RepID=A0A6G1HS69_9PEZI|nr:hypothetical protein EJ06DRAFT_94441 [Trichodelitschia bisporula]
MDTLIKLSGVAEGINDLEGALKGLDKSVHGVQGTVSTMGASLTGLFDTFEQRQGTMAAVWAQQDSINARFESASNNVDMVRVKLNAMYDEVPALTEDLRDLRQIIVNTTELFVNQSDILMSNNMKLETQADLIDRLQKASVSGGLRDFALTIAAMITVRVASLPLAVVIGSCIGNIPY